MITSIKITCMLIGRSTFPADAILFVTCFGLECNSFEGWARLNFKTVGLKKQNIISVLIKKSLFGNAKT